MYYSLWSVRPVNKLIGNMYASTHSALETHFKLQQWFVIQLFISIMIGIQYYIVMFIILTLVSVQTCNNWLGSYWENKLKPKKTTNKLRRVGSRKLTEVGLSHVWAGNLFSFRHAAHPFHVLKCSEFQRMWERGYRPSFKRGPNETSTLFNSLPGRKCQTKP